MANLTQIGVDLNIANSRASEALTSYQIWMAGRAGRVTLTTDQKNTLKAEFTADITAVRDAAQAVINDINT